MNHVELSWTVLSPQDRASVFESRETSRNYRCVKGAKNKIVRKIRNIGRHVYKLPVYSRSSE